ncbi:plasmid mobilization protein [Pseudomonas aeruginosa]|uniref:plasmid mobilization protein n=1 Tax=Pseudomonas aeruginosa TaxID=287 RepID=UPI001F4AB56F|nr:plasmid mobilization relaxosome protein MobC [Pseudomonas aeruginosa]MDG4735997.1 plasmid mobilization relaxosome protein MobC [Pseudomonas aeruginosa]
MSDKKAARSQVVAFRVPDEKFAPYEQKLKELGISKSDFFRKLLLERLDQVTIVAPSKDNAKLLFLYNKASNNLNQLAHRVHLAYKSEIVSERLYLKLMNSLAAIHALLLSGVDDADSS